MSYRCSWFLLTANRSGACCNASQGATLNTATEAGIRTVRLPIQENIPERLDHILNVNTVVDVLINFRELGDWPRTLEIALPQVH